VARAVGSVLDQAFTAGDLEVIVVNDSGEPLPAGDWQSSPRVRQIETSGRRGPSLARNAGAAIARGRYLHFLDDDDWLLPNALDAFWELSQRAARADWLYGGIRLVNDAGLTLREFNPGLDGNIHTQLVAGAWITLVASLIRREAFVAAQGYEPSLAISEEIDLGRRLTRRGDVAQTPAVVACVLRGGGGHTSTINGPLGPEINRWSRDRALAMPGAFGRLLGSAHTAYWRGRVLQAYLAAAHWNWTRGQYTASANRAGYAMLSLALASPSWLSGDYWQAVRDAQVPFSAGRVLSGLV